jgi:hypothetical protein
MTDPFCPEVSPASGALCGVAANIVHSRHFALDGTTWDTEQSHQVPVEKPSDWLWEQLGIDTDRVDPQEFLHLLGEYELRRTRQLWSPPQALVTMEPGAPGPMMLRPCTCCHCTGSSLCFHQDEGGCWWRGPGR